MKLNQSLISFSWLALAALPMQARERLNFDEGWLFTLADSAGMEKNDYADLGVATSRLAARLGD